jgi:hypothetical protein
MFLFVKNKQSQNAQAYSLDLIVAIYMKSTLAYNLNHID